MSAPIIRRGRAFVFGDQIDTDVLAPGPYMKKPLAELARHCMEAVDPGFATRVRPGDIVVGGVGFGIGSSREQAVQALLELGVGAVVAKGFARIFYRNALNLGIPCFEADLTGELTDGQEVEFDVSAGRIVADGRAIQLPPPPAFLREVWDAGGIVPFYKAHGRFPGQA